MLKPFQTTIDLNGKGAREDGNGRRRQITFHSFRRFVKTTISDLGYADYSEYFIGHSGYTYWRKKDSEKAEIFCKIETYLTSLNVHQLERQGADIQTKVEELEQLNQSMRERGIDSGGIDRASGIAHGEYGGRCEFVVGGTGFGKGCKSV